MDWHDWASQPSEGINRQDTRQDAPAVAQNDDLQQGTSARSHADDPKPHTRLEGLLPQLATPREHDAQAQQLSNIN